MVEDSRNIQPEVRPSDGRAAPAAESPADGGPLRRVPLNTFQMFMKQWTRLGPYNAGQAMRVSGSPNMPRLSAAASRVLGEIGLGVPEFNGEQVCFHPVNAVQVQMGGPTLEAAAAEQLNVPFGSSDLPLRFFIIPGDPPNSLEKGESHWVLVVYDHWLADSSAMRQFMQLLAAYYLDRKLSGPDGAAAKLRLPDENFRWPPTGKFSAVGWWGSILTGLKYYIQHRRAWRLNVGNPLDFTVGLKIQKLPAGLIEQLRQAARRRKASVNDLFLAAMAQSIEALMRAGQASTCGGLLGPRNRISLGTIVDMRPAAGPMVENIFGLFLGFSTTRVKVSGCLDRDFLVETVSSQTRTFKAAGAVGAALRTLDVARFFWGFYKEPRHQAVFFQKNTPVVAGISNVNLTGEWMCPATPDAGFPILDFVRISPTGPLLPLVFTLTTTGPYSVPNRAATAEQGAQLSLSLTWRKAAIAESTAMELSDHFIGFLQELAK